MKSLYAAFDLYPSSKGAATHIQHFAASTFEHFSGGVLAVLGRPSLAKYQEEGPIHIHRILSQEENYLKRGENFSKEIFLLTQQYPKLELVHFRDIWSGLGLLHAQQSYQAVFEINGLPSIELPYRYPQLSEITIDKIRKLENFCIQKSQQIIVPSKVIKNHLESRKLEFCPPIDIIPNGADIPIIDPKDKLDIPNFPYLIYFGAFQSWQGVDDLLKAFALLWDFENLHLVLCSAHKQQRVKAFRKLAQKLAIEDRIIWKYQLPKENLYPWIQGAVLSIAPLQACKRNLVQGCSPLKILESIACGTAVIASDIPAVRELVQDKKHAWLSQANRPAELARNIRLLLEYPQERERLAKEALAHLKNHFLWTDKKQDLKAIYQKLLSNKTNEYV